MQIQELVYGRLYVHLYNASYTLEYTMYCVYISQLSH